MLQETKKRKIVCSRFVQAWIAGLCVYAMLGFLPIEARSEDLSQSFFQFLKSAMGLSESEIKTVKAGQIITKQLKTDVKHEVLIFSVMHVNVSPQIFAEHYGKGKLSIERATAENFGIFSQPPQIEDIQTLTLRSVSLEELKKCKDGECKLKAPLALIEAFAQVDKSAGDAKEQIDTALRKSIVAFAHSYLKDGIAGMIEYRDQKNPSRVTDEFQDILGHSPYLNTYLPEFLEYLKNFPKGTLAHATNEIYWMVENFGGSAKRLTISLNHAILYQPKPETMVVSSTQLYANHYYEAALGLTIMVKVPDDPQPGVYVLHINRSRIDVLRRVPRMLATDLFEGAQSLIHEKMTIIKGNLEKLTPS